MSETKSIPIKSIYKFQNSDNNFTQYCYCLKLYMKNDEDIILKKTTDDKFIQIISFNDNINFNDIERYELEVKIITFSEETYFLKGEINTKNYYISKNDKLNIEFIKNNLENTLCSICCLNLSKNKLFISPPNY